MDTHELDFLDELELHPELLLFDDLEKPKKKKEIYLEDQLELCPLCGEIMIVKSGRYGYFWSCKRFPACKGSKNIEKLKDLALIKLDFYEPDSFIRSEPFKEIKDILENENIAEYIKPLGSIIERDWNKGFIGDEKNKGKISGLLDYLCRSEKRFLLAQFIYFIFRLADGDLPERFDFFLNSIYKKYSLESFVRYKEYQITNSIVENWDKTPFSLVYGLKLFGKEIPLRQITHSKNNSKVDIVATTDKGEYFLIEVKRTSLKSRNAWGQLHVYREIVKASYGRAGGYIVTCGYPRDVIDSTIGLIGYTIQGGSMALIPWREGKIM